MYKVRYDMLICLVVAGLMGLLTAKVMPGIYAIMCDRYEKAHTVADGEIGGLAGNDVVRVSDIEELLSKDTFTVEMKESTYLVSKTAYFGKIHLHNIKLPSGERVAARINDDAVGDVNDEYMVSLPVGKVVYADLSKDADFMEKIVDDEEGLSRTDFYLDMVGTGSTAFVSVDTYDRKYTIFIQAAVFIVTFILLHTIGSKIGFFPRFFNKKSKDSPTLADGGRKRQKQA